MLTVDDVHVRYGAIEAVRGATLQVDEGEIVTLIGPNGAGKTSLINAVAGLVPAAAGRIVFEGRDVSRMQTEDIIAGGVGVVPEHRRLFGDLTVRENLLLGASSRRERPSAADLDRIYDHFPILKERSSQHAGYLSGGEAQQLALGRALMGKPRLLLLDEPSLGLAPIIVDRVFEMLRALRMEEGLTMLLVEQNAFKALELADRAYILSSGEISESRDAREVAAQDDLVSAYLAAPTSLEI